jgi:putative transposase
MTITTNAADTAAVSTDDTTGERPRRGTATTATGVDAAPVERLVAQARERGPQLSGQGGLPQRLTKIVLASAPDAEITEHLGHDRHEPAGANGGNSGDGVRAKTVPSGVGPVQLSVPGDRDAWFQPAIVGKRRRRLSGVQDMVPAPSATGLTTGQIGAHPAGVYRAQVAKQTPSPITDEVIDGIADRRNRPLGPVYPVVFPDAINVKVRDGKVANRPIHVALAVTAEGTRDILGWWAGDGGEGAKFCLAVCTALKNRGVDDVPMAVRDGLEGVPDAIAEGWPKTAVQACVVQLPRTRCATPGGSTGTRSRRPSSRSAPHRPRPPRPDGCSSSPRAGATTTRRSSSYGRTPGPGSPGSRPSARRSAGSSAPPTPSRRSTPASAARSAPRGRFPNEQAALDCVYLAVLALDRTGRGTKRWITRWKPALNAVDLAFDGRLSAGRR